MNVAVCNCLCGHGKNINLLIVIMTFQFLDNIFIVSSVPRTDTRQFRIFMANFMLSMIE